MIESLSRWFAPGMRLMMQLRMPVKFALITLAFLAPLVITLLAVMSYASDGIDFTREEQKGVTYLRLLNPLLGQVAREHSGANLDLGALNKQIAADNDQWHLKPAITSLQQSKDSDATAVLLDMYTQLADQSGLILDPDIDSYYMMAIAILNSPQLTLSQGQLGKIHHANAGIESIESVTSTDTQGTMLADFLYGKLLEESRQITHAIERGSKGNPTLSHAFDDGWRNANDALTQAIRRNDSNLNRIAEESVTQTLALNKQALDQLDGLLVQRIDRLKAKRNLYLFIALGCLLLAGYLITSFYLSEIKGFWGLTKRMQRLADGNLVADFGAQGKDEIGQLIDAFESSRGQLHALVEQIHGAAQTISSAGDEIASANLDLSKRSADQATMVGTTANQIHTITEKVHANLEAAASANSISLEAFKAAEQGKKVMDQVVATMSTMKSSSTKIGAIIDVINAIAFQTNLLALNAAVEAARAGEQGRGFAVVAGEVRNLAQRCATAANEITQLIKASVDGVNTGVAQVDDAGKSMVEILDSVQTVSAIMGEMVEAGRAQTSSTQGIQAAVRRIEEDASENAAMVEQTASAADLLRQQVDSLMQAISRFNVGAQRAGQGSHHASAPSRSEAAAQTARAA